jgi:hypothetical protein
VTSVTLRGKVITSRLSMAPVRACWYPVLASEILKTVVSLAGTYKRWGDWIVGIRPFRAAKYEHVAPGWRKTVVSLTEDRRAVSRSRSGGES